MKGREFCDRLNDFRLEGICCTKLIKIFTPLSLNMGWTSKGSGSNYRLQQIYVSSPQRHAMYRGSPTPYQMRTDVFPSGQKQVGRKAEHSRYFSSDINDAFS